MIKINLSLLCCPARFLTAVDCLATYTECRQGVIRYLYPRLPESMPSKDTT